MLIVLSCLVIRWHRANRVVGVLRSGWKFFWDIGRLAPTVQTFFSPVGCFLPKIGVWARGGAQNARKSRKKLKITQNMYFDIFICHSKFHNVWTMFDRFFLHFTIFMVFLIAFRLGVARKTRGKVGKSWKSPRTCILTYCYVTYNFITFGPCFSAFFYMLLFRSFFFAFH